VRWSAARALDGRDGQDVTAGLLACLDDTQWILREAAARALAGREGQDVTTALLACLDDPEEQLRQAAAQALDGREGEDVTAGLLARLDNPEEQVRQAAALMLARRDSPADLVLLARHNWTQSVPFEVLSAAYDLMTRHYQALPPPEQEMVRARMILLLPL